MPKKNNWQNWLTYNYRAKKVGERIAREDNIPPYLRVILTPQQLKKYRQGGVIQITENGGYEVIDNPLKKVRRKSDNREWRMDCRPQVFKSREFVENSLHCDEDCPYYVVCQNEPKDYPANFSDKFEVDFFLEKRKKYFEEVLRDKKLLKKLKK